MKRAILILFIIASFIFSFLIFARTIIPSLIRRQIKNAFQASQVSIESCNFRPFHSLSLSGIKITDKKLNRTKIDDLTINFSLFSRSGNFNLNGLQYGKFKAEDIRGTVKLRGRSLLFDNLYAKLFRGELFGNLELSLGKIREYRGNLELKLLDLDTIIKDFDLKEKFLMSGKLSGRAYFSGAGVKVKELSGNLSTLEPGGTLIIKDTRFLENMARGSGQPLDVLMDGFKDYHYNTGIMTLSSRNGDILLDVGLDGEAGKRNLNIVLHNLSMDRK